jgi:hypothetical protein
MLIESLKNITAKILINQHVLCLIKTHTYGIRLHHIKVYLQVRYLPAWRYCHVHYITISYYNVAAVAKISH